MQQHWSGYLNAIGAQKSPQTSMPTVAPYETTSSQVGVTGFMDLTPKNPQIQSKFDAMQKTWQGSAAAEAAVAGGLFKAEAMPIEHK